MPSGIFKGIGVSKGVAVGKCLLLEVQEKKVGEERLRSVAENVSEPEDEADRFASAVERVKQELQSVKVKVVSEAGKDAGEIFEAQILMLEDPLLISEVINRIRDDELTAEEAVSQTAEHLMQRFSTLSSTYMRERSDDIRDLCSRLVDILKGGRERIAMLVERVKKEGARVVLASENLAAATIAHFGKKRLAGVVAETGGSTSHLAIVARSLGIPTVLGVKNIVRELKDGDQVLVDGDKGEVIVNPTEAEVEKRMRRTEISSVETVLSLEPTTTTDGHRVKVFANVANLEGVREAVSSGAEGVGLFRTEFLYFDREAPPTEEELINVMKQSISIMQGKTVIVRTLDIGGDKKPSYIEFPKEKNPALGLRGIRYCLRMPSLLETQVTAILQASIGSNVWIMFPMVTTLKELKQAKQLVEEAKRALRKKGTSFNANMKVGIMIETPSAALMSDEFAREADFFSIGTNDLVQYTMAADRENDNVSAIADPFEPSVLRLIKQTIDNARTRNLPVALCGEMAADADAVPLLLGLGLDEFSVDPSNIEAIKRVIPSVKYSETKETALEALRLESASDIRLYLRSRYQQKRRGSISA